MIDYTETVGQMADALVARAHHPGTPPCIIAGLGAAFAVLGECVGDEEVDEDTLLESCRCFVQYTMSFSVNLSEGEIPSIITEINAIALELFGDERTELVWDQVREEFEELGEEFSRCGLRREQIN